jgi:hypothetical protein
MKTYLYPTGIVKPRTISYSSKKTILFFLFIGLAFLSFAHGGGGKLNFKNSKLESGHAGKDGAVYRFPQVTDEMDALVKIKARSNSLVYLVNIDMVTSGFDKAWQPQVGYNNGTVPTAADWWMDFEMTFVKKGTNIVESIDEFDLSAIDIDGNGDKISEYVGFYGLKSFTVEENSLLALSNLTQLINNILGIVGKRFDGPTTNFGDIDTSGTSVMTTAKYVNTEVYTVRVGGVARGKSSASERMYSFYFQDFKYNQPQQVTLPVTLKSFDAKLVSGKASLKWVSSAEVNFSHYSVQRSFDGRDFSDVTMIMSDAKKLNDVSYTYSENIGKATGLIYYRLKMVDIDGKYKYSAIRILKMDASGAALTLSTYPNPVANELRITIPAQWQDRKVVYDMFNTEGKIVKRQVSERASQTEVLYLSDVNVGSYVIRLSSGDQSLAQQIVKSR